MKKKFRLDGHGFTAEDCVDRVLINPSLPRMFDDTPNEDRPAAQRKWWGRPFIVKQTVEELDAWYAKRRDDPKDEHGIEQYAKWHDQGRDQWLKRWPDGGTRYNVRCLDGGAWDRSTSIRFCKTLAEALDASGPRGTYGSWPGA